MSEQEAVGVGGGEMDRAHREDYELEQACREAVRVLQKIIDSPLMQGRRASLSDARDICQNKADHIVAVWD